MIVGAYTLHLYCDGPRHRELHPNKVGSLDAEFTGYSEADCNKQARAKGWRLDHKNGRCRCARCIKAESKK